MHLQAHSRAFVNFQPVEVHRTSMVRKRRLATQAGSSWSWGDSPASSISSASIPPSDWYFSESSHRLDAERVFGRGWQIADVHPLSPGTYRSGTLSNGSGATEYLLVKAEDGTLRGFHNVTFHVQVAANRPLEPWQFVADAISSKGKLVKAPRITGIQDFAVADFGLKALPVAEWGPFIFLCLDDIPPDDAVAHLHDWIGAEPIQLLKEAGVLDDDLVHVRKQSFALRCNWKVFCDNYLDGGYHVPVAHPDLAAGLDLDAYSSRIFDSCSVQTCTPDGGERLGQRPVAYAFLMPNLMINRYGPWMDVNVVQPTGPGTCVVHFDWWIKRELAGDVEFVDGSIAASVKVQDEDTALCESVQRGLESKGFASGRYAPLLEAPMFHFHQLLHQRYSRDP